MSKITMLATALALLVATSATTFAGPKGGNAKNSPGHMMQSRGSLPGYPGASGYAPGQVKKMNRATNARAYAPRYQTDRRRQTDTRRQRNWR